MHGIDFSLAAQDLAQVGGRHPQVSRQLAEPDGASPELNHFPRHTESMGVPAQVVNEESWIRGALPLLGVEMFIRGLGVLNPPKKVRGSKTPRRFHWSVSVMFLEVEQERPKHLLFLVWREVMCPHVIRASQRMGVAGRVTVTPARNREVKGEGPHDAVQRSQNAESGRINAVEFDPELDA